MDWFKIGGAAVIGALLASGPVFLYARSVERTALEATAARDALERLGQMEKNDAKFKEKSPHDRCLEFMRFSKLRAEDCD